MPGGGQPIVIGGGIQLTGGAIDEFLVLTSINPATATTSPRWRRSGNALIGESTPGREDTVIGPGTTGNAGTGSNTEVLIGRNISLNHNATGTPSILISGNAITATQPNNVVIANSLAASITNTQNVIIGDTVAQAGVQNMTGIGSGLSLNASNVVVIGRAALGQGSHCVAIGVDANADANAIAIGSGTIAGSTGSVLIGRFLQGSGQRMTVIGTGWSPGNDYLCIGHGGGFSFSSGMMAIGNGIDVTTFPAGTIAIGHNNGGGGGNYSSSVLWGGAFLHAANVAVPAWTETHKAAQGNNVNAGDVTYNLPRATGTGTGGAWIIQTATTEASGSTLQTLAEVARFSPGTATQPRNFQITTDKGLWFANQTDGAGAGAGTLTNAPTAGNPTFWLPVRINGADFFIPCWP